MARPLSRRAFLQRAGLVAAGAATAGLRTSPAAGARPPQGGLSAKRARTYTALVGTVAVAQGKRADRAYAARACEEFGSWYQASLPHVRASVNATLDAIGPRARTLSGHSPALLAQAVTLASPPFRSYDDDGIRCSPGPV